MPNCFRLIDKDSKKPAILYQVDDDLRKHFGAEPDKRHWFLNWYNSVGLLLSIGKTWGEIFDALIDEDSDQILGEVILYMMMKYDSESWYEHK